MDTFGDPHLAAVLIKKYLRDLPDPLFPEALYPIIQRCPTPTDDPTDWSALLYIRDTLLPELPRCSYILLSHVLRECFALAPLNLGYCGTAETDGIIYRFDARSLSTVGHEPHGRTQSHRRSLSQPR